MSETSAIQSAPRHTVVWFDIYANDIDRAIDFYTKLLGRPVHRNEMEGQIFGVFDHGMGEVGGCLLPSNGEEPSGKGPMMYFNVDGRHEEAEQIVADNGGTVLQPKHGLGPHGFRSFCLDSEGNRIALHSN